MAKGNFGERLKREREMREVSLAEVTAGTRIGPKFLEALENEEWEKLPGGIFSRGFVRSIARYLGLDEEDFLAEYDLARGEQQIEAPAPYENAIPSPPKWIPVLALLAIIALCYGVFHAARYAWRKHTESQANQAAESPDAVDDPANNSNKGSDSSTSRLAAAGGANSKLSGIAGDRPGAIASGEIGGNAAGQRPVAAGGLSSQAATASPGGAGQRLELTVTTSVSSRVRVVADNQVLLDGGIEPGDTHHFSATTQFQISAEHGAAVHLELNGQPVAAHHPFGTPGTSDTIVLGFKDLKPPSGGLRRSGNLPDPAGARP
jgi:cytoskeleton protein RodZ